MRSAFIGLILCVCGTVYGGEEASVLVNQPVVAAEPTPAAAPVVVASKPCCNKCACKHNACAAPKSKSTVHTRTRYRVVNEGCDECTGQPTRSVSRGVVRSTGAAVQSAGGVIVDVFTLPARVCRNGRCN